MKSCAKCKQQKPFEDFYRYSRSSDGRQSYCKVCTGAATSAYSKDPRRKAYLKKYKEDNRNKELKRSAEYRQKNRQALKEKGQEYVASNPQKVSESKRNYRERHRGRVRESSKRYRELNRPKYARYRALRRAREKQAQPSWLTSEDLARMDLMWGLRELKSFVEGVEYEVDHIVPLRGETICGLHVPWNLRVIPKEENRRKLNREWPDMWPSNAKED